MREAGAAAAGLPLALRFRTRDGRWLPELDAFAAPPWEETLPRLGANLRRAGGAMIALRRFGPVAAAILLGTGCAGSASPACPAGTMAARELTAWFGLHSAARGRELTETEWQGFRDRVLVPAFPQGSTVTPGHGAWRHADGRIGHEATRVLTVLVPAAEELAALARLRAAIAAYGDMHPQEAVGIASRPACTLGFF